MQTFSEGNRVFPHVLIETAVGQSARVDNPITIAAWGASKHLC